MFNANHVTLLAALDHVIGHDEVTATYTVGRNLFAVVDSIRHPLTNSTMRFRVRFWRLDSDGLVKVDDYDFESANYYDTVARIYALDSELMRPDDLAGELVVAYRCGNGIYVYVTTTQDGYYRVTPYYDHHGTMVRLHGETKTFFSCERAIKRIAYFEPMSDAHVRELAGIDD
ncbi:MAG: hypothetical protein D6683_01545 [Actinomyces sp.]|nr:MAG: hypothetical protein D6683_01545 [Actinomyces sp.]